MKQYLRDHELAEKIIADEFADLNVRANACATLLQYPLANGLRQDLRRMFLDISDQLAEVQS
jgi:hypothetical protein